MRNLWRRSRVCPDVGRTRGLAAAGIVAILFATWQLFVIPASHDELHFCHAAWLAQQGLRPFNDFLYHNSPGILYLLRAYAVWDPDFGVEIIVWGRLLCLASLWLTALVLARIGTLAYSRNVGLLSLVLVAPMLVIPYNITTLRRHHWCIRPEVLVMPLAFAALYCTMRLLENGAECRGSDCPRKSARTRHLAALKQNRAFSHALVASGSAGIALFFSPRIVFLCLGLVLLVLLERKSLNRSAWLGLALGAVIPLALYGWLVGPADTYTWIYKYVNFHRPGDQGRLTYLRPHPGKFILALSLAESLYLVCRPRFARMRRLAIVQLALLSAVVVETEPSLPTCQLSFPVACVLFAYVLVCVLERRTKIAWAVAIGLVALCWVYPARTLMNNVRLLTRPELQLSQQVAAYRQVCSALQGDTVLVDPVYHPVAVLDASYFWTQFARLATTLAQADIESPKLDVINDCVRRPPVVLWEPALDAVAKGPDEHVAIHCLLARMYGRTASGSGLFVRRDRMDSLGAVIDAPRVMLNLTGNDSTAARSGTPTPP